MSAQKQLEELLDRLSSKPATEKVLQELDRLDRALSNVDEFGRDNAFRQPYSSMPKLPKRCWS